MISNIPLNLQSGTLVKFSFYYNVYGTLLAAKKYIGKENAGIIS